MNGQSASQRQSKLEARVEELETKVAFQDDTIDQLSNEIEQHQGSIHQLQQQLRLLGDRFKEIKQGLDHEQPQAIEYEVPPHY